MKVKINFADFWKGFDGKFFIWILERAGYEVEISPNPDLLIYSIFGNSHKNFSCKKLYFTGENTRPPQDEYALSFDFSDNPKHYRFPLYAYQRWIWAKEGANLDPSLEITLDTILESKELSKEDLFEQKKNFCAFLISNASCLHRNSFFQALSQKKHVISAGTAFNNFGRVVSWNEKLSFLKSFKFVIAFENTSYTGYVTEKIFEPMLVKTVPIYWGSDTAKEEFNSYSYVDVNGLSIESAIEKIILLDSNDDLYYQMYKQPYLKNNKETEFMKFENLINFINKIL